MKKVLYLIGGLVVLVLGAALLSPKEMSSTRSIVINAPKEIIYQEVKSLRNHEKWSPWKDKAPNMKTTFSGNDGTVGSKYSWESDVEGVGSGSQTITSLKENESVLMDLDFNEKGKAEGFIYLKDTTGGVQVSWGFRAKVPVPFNLMMLFANTEAADKDFDTGLSKLKTLCEGLAAAQTPVLGTSEIKEINFLGKEYVGIRTKVGISKVSEWYGPAIGKVMEAAKSKNAMITGNASGLYFTWDDQKTMTTDMAAAIPVATKTAAGNDFQSIEIKPSKALQVDYRGGYSGSGAAHTAMDVYIKKNGLQQVSPVIEEYIVGPASEPDSNKWLTRIIYLIKN